MFTIENRGIFHRRKRLVAPTKLAEADFHEVANRIGRKPFKARKIGFVAARKAEDTQTVVTKWDGTESTNVARPGDWILTNLSTKRQVLHDKDGNTNTYVVRAETFTQLYEPMQGSNELGQFYNLSGGFDILAPWGQKQTAGTGYLMLNGGDVYGNNETTFAATYEVVH
jgi:hypothetical protein